MKKSLLSIATLAATALTAMANEYTFVFDGNNDMGGLTRQASINQDELTFSEEFSLNEEGIELSVKNTATTGMGFALVNAGGSNAGLLVYASMNTNTSMSPQISMTVPNGKINAAKVYMSGTALLNLSLYFNGKELSSEKVGDLYAWEWSDKTGTETLNVEWVNNFCTRFIHKI
ncbi:MAG: hypothetical protein K2L00_09465, partial [Muribaculaceae bacterium]|nr:hypothetical protein [Muribaculaceae bacterium]